MTLQTFTGEMFWPGLASSVGNTPAFNSSTLVDAAGEYEAAVIVAREAMTISHIGLRVGTVTASGALDVRVETVDPTTGLPTGTLWAANTNKTTGALTSNTFALFALTASASISVGQVFAVVMTYNAGTSVQLQRLINLGPSVPGLPYLTSSTAGSPAKIVASGGSRSWALGSNSTTFYYVPGLTPATAFNNNAFNNTNSAARGLRFTLPYPCKILGLAHWNSTSNGDLSAVLYDDAGAELSNSSTAYDGDVMANSANGWQHLYFDNPVSIAANTPYRAAVEPSTATNITLATISLPSADYRSAYACGTSGLYATRSSGTWTDTATDQLPLLDVIISAFDGGGLPASRLQLGH